MPMCFYQQNNAKSYDTSSSSSGMTVGKEGTELGDKPDLFPRKNGKCKNDPILLYTFFLLKNVTK